MLVCGGSEEVLARGGGGESEGQQAEEEEGRGCESGDALGKRSRSRCTSCDRTLRAREGQDQHLLRVRAQARGRRERTLSPRVAHLDLERVLRRRVHLLERLTPRLPLRRSTARLLARAASCPDRRRRRRWSRCRGAVSGPRARREVVCAAEARVEGRAGLVRDVGRRRGALGEERRRGEVGGERDAHEGRVAGRGGDQAWCAGVLCVARHAGALGAV